MKKEANKGLEIKEIAIITILFLVITTILIILTNLDRQIITGLITGIDNNVDQNDSQNDQGENNFTFSAINLSVNLISPENASYKNVNNINFNCSVQSDPKQIINITFKLSNESSLIYSETKELTGILNSTTFNYNLSEENIYYWSCEAYNNEAGLATATNFSITYDTISPIINLIEPENGKSYTTTNNQETEFTFTINDKLDINNCSLISNNEIKLTNNSVDKNLTQNFRTSFTPGNYEWSINCIDKANNIGNSEKRSFSISSIESSGESSSEENEERSESEEKDSASSENGEGSGEEGRSVVVGEIEKPKKTYFISNEQFSVGYTKELNKKDEIKFVFEDEKIFNHSLTVNEIANDFVEITVQSEPINLRLGIGEEKKLNLTNPNNYDFYVRLNSINNNKANITIQLINEEIKNEIQTGISGFTIEEQGNETGISKIIGFVTKSIKPGGAGKGSLLIYLIIAVIIIFIIVFFFRKHKEKTIKSN